MEGGLDARPRPCCGQIDDDEAEFVEGKVSFQKKRVSMCVEVPLEF